MKKRAVILTCILSASILLSGSYILPLLNHIAEKETKTVKTYQTASQDEAETDSSEADAGDTEDTDSEKSSKDQTVLDQATIMYEQYNYQVPDCKVFTCRVSTGTDHTCIFSHTDRGHFQGF